MESIGISDIGLVRKQNQDYYYLSEKEEFPLFIIADGMGGHKGGEIASETAVKISKKVFKENTDEINSLQSLEDLIEKAIYMANKTIYEKSKLDENLDGMGTTIIIVYKFQEKLVIGHIGDSRCYIYNNGSINQITEDDSLVNKLVQDGEITEEQAKKHKKRNVITKALGTKRDVVPSIYKYKLKEEDILLMCTDGLTDMVDDKMILEIFEKNKDIIGTANLLVKEANKQGGKDNITTLIVKFQDEVKK